ncbi:MAG: hypothetical protein ACLFV7_09605, partial [Phycisphaerae bacterium]
MSRLSNMFRGGYALRRRRRFWRFVSPHRRGAGLILLAMLLGIFYGYWYFTNAARVRLLAEQYLQELTGAEVTIHDAEFNLFGPVELRHVRLFVADGNSPLPLFEAQELSLRHVPWTLISGRLSVTEIVCSRPTVNIEYYDEGGNSARKLFGEATEEQQKRWRVDVPLDLPRIRLLDSKLRTFQVSGDLRDLNVEYELHISLTPMGGVGYKVEFEEPDTSKRPYGTLVVDIGSGDVDVERMFTPIVKAMAAMPQRYREWVDQYQIDGNMYLPENGEFDVEEGIFEVRLDDVSMKPLGADGLVVENVNGNLRFDANGVQLGVAFTHKKGGNGQGDQPDEITGLLPTAGGGKLTMKGSYEGYDANAALKVDISMSGIRLPDPNADLGPLREIVSILHKDYRPQGRFDLDLKVRRPTGGKVQVTGTAKPLGITGRYRYFPYPVHDVRGTITFGQDGHRTLDLKGGADEARFTILGDINQDPNVGLGYRVQIIGKSIPFDKRLTAALAPRYAAAVNWYDPEGHTDANVVATRDAETGRDEISVQILPNGQASMAYEGLPYRIHDLTGQIHLTHTRAEIRKLRGRSGKGTCTLDGTITGIDTGDPAVDLKLTASDLAIDDELLAALGKDANAVLQALGVRGRVARLVADVTRKPGHKLQFALDADLADVGIRYRQFPYELTDGNAEISVTPGRVVIHRFVGRHGSAKVRLTGQALVADGKTGMDLQIDANDIALDEDLASALPPEARGAWKSLRPGGVTDVSVTWRQDMPEQETSPDYRVEVRPDGRMSMTPLAMPVKLDKLVGKVVVTPSKVDIVRLRSAEGSAKVDVSGTVRHDEGRE